MDYIKIQFLPKETAVFKILFQPLNLVCQDHEDRLKERDKESRERKQDKR